MEDMSNQAELTFEEIDKMARILFDHFEMSFGSRRFDDAPRSCQNDWRHAALSVLESMCDPNWEEGND